MAHGGATNPRWKAFAAAWCGHGAALGSSALILPLMAEQVASAEWAESMSMLGAGDLVQPMRQAMAATAGWTPWILGLSGLCLLAGGLALLRPRAARWPLHLGAAVHVVLLPLATWRMHGSADLGLAASAAEWVSVAVLIATAGLSSWYVERMRSTGARSSN